MFRLWLLVLCSDQAIEPSRYSRLFHADRSLHRLLRHSDVISLSSIIFIHGASFVLPMLHSRRQWLCELIGEPLVFQHLLPGSCLQAYTVLCFIILVLQAPHVLSCLCYSLTNIQILNSDAIIITEASRPKNAVHEIQVLPQVNP